MTDWTACERRLAAGVDALGVQVGAAAQAQLIAFIKELAIWNATYNLTAVRDPATMVTRHLLDCLAVVDFVTGQTLADVGSGAGLPGLVLAIARPTRAVTLIEASRRKAAFLRHARRTLALTNVAVVQARVEVFHPETRFDDVICRAFARAGECARVAGHLVAPSGRLLLMKGRVSHVELADLPADFRHVDTIALHVPGLDAERHLVILAPG
jgi:16S rRNA (guanine527-N7)-methyltransferase